MANNIVKSSADVFNRLSSGVYLHSATENFIEVSRQYMSQSKQEKSVNAISELQQAQDLLEKQIDRITFLCNDFYRLLGLTREDSYNASGEDINFSLNGAREFQQRFLINKTGTASSASTILLQAMNSKKYQNECIKRAKSLKDQKYNRSISKSKEFIDLMQILSMHLADSVQSVWRNVGDITGEVVENSIESLLKRTETKTKRGTTTHLRLKKTVSGNLKKLLGSSSISDEIKAIFTDGSRGLNLNTNQGVKKAIDNFKGYFLKVSLSEFVDIMWEVLTQQEPQITNIISESNFKSFFIDELSSYGNIDFTTNIPAFSGMQLEQPFIFGMNLELNKIFSKSNLWNMTIRGLGQQQETKTYRDESVSTSMSGSDFIFELKDKTGKTIKSFRIQAKNSLQDQDFISIRLNDKIKLKTYANRILSPNEASILEYFVLNKAFLSQYGMVRGNETRYDEQIHHGGSFEQELYKVQDHKALESYIFFFLNQTIAYLIGGKVYEETNNKSYWNQETQNLFFIFKGQYLIPVSLFLYSAYRLIGELKKRVFDQKMDSKLHINGTIGELTYSKNLESLQAGSTFAKQLRLDKFYYLNHRTDLKYQEDHGNGAIYTKRYPDNLVSIGSAAGQQLLQNASFPRINFTMHLQEINKLLALM